MPNVWVHPGRCGTKGLAAFLSEIKAGRSLDMLRPFTADLVPVRLRTDEAVNSGPLIDESVEGAHTKWEETGPGVTPAEERRAALGAGRAVETGTLAVVVQVVFASEDTKRFLADGGVGSERRPAVLAAQQWQ